MFQSHYEPEVVGFLFGVVMQEMVILECGVVPLSWAISNYETLSTDDKIKLNKIVRIDKFESHGKFNRRDSRGELFDIDVNPTY
jgi:hypothetical protein